MTKTQPSLEPDQCFDVLDEEKIGEDSEWSDDRDPVPEGWEDWVELESAQTDDQDSIDWSDLELDRPKTVVGYRNDSTVIELGTELVETLCDTGATRSQLLLNSEQLAKLSDVQREATETEPSSLQVTIRMGGREEKVLLQLRESEDGPKLLLGRDVLGQGWVVDVGLVSSASIENSNQS